MVSSATSVRWTTSDVLDDSRDPIDGRFKPRRVLGEGGFGVVVEAWDIQLQQPVALKLLHRVHRQNPLLGSLDTPREEETDDTSSPSEQGSPTTSELVERADSNSVNIKRFRKEAQALAKVRSPHCVQVLGCSTWWGGWYIAMEYVEGKNLHHFRAGKRLPEWLTLKILAGVARGLHAAHTRGIVHRDVKPENIMLPAGNLMESQQAIKITDFGIAKVLFHDEDEDRPVTELSNTGTFVGTKSYSAPEQLLCEPVDGRTDVYCLGLVAYECIMGRRALDIPSQAIVELTKYATQSDTSFTVDAQANCSPALATLVNEMLLKRRALRPKDMREVYRRAEKLLGQETTLERGYTGSIGLAFSAGQLEQLAAPGEVEHEREVTAETLEARPIRREEAENENDTEARFAPAGIAPVLVGTGVMGALLLIAMVAAFIWKGERLSEPAQVAVAVEETPETDVEESAEALQMDAELARGHAVSRATMKADAVARLATSSVEQAALARVKEEEEEQARLDEERRRAQKKREQERRDEQRRQAQEKKAKPIAAEKTKEDEAAAKSTKNKPEEKKEIRWFLDD